MKQWISTGAKKSTAFPWKLWNMLYVMKSWTFADKNSLGEKEGGT